VLIPASVVGRRSPGALLEATKALEISVADASSGHSGRDLAIGNVVLDEAEGANGGAAAEPHAGQDHGTSSDNHMRPHDYPSSLDLAELVRDCRATEMAVDEIVTRRVDGHAPRNAHEVSNLDARRPEQAGSNADVDVISDRDGFRAGRDHGEAVDAYMGAHRHILRPKDPDAVVNPNIVADGCES
jgi:hypothetical protein